MVSRCRVKVSHDLHFPATFGVSNERKKSMKLGAIICMLAITSYGHAQTTNTINNQSNTNNMKNETKRVVTEFLNAVQVGDLEQLGTLLHPNMEWVQPGNNRVSGLKRSSAEVFQMVGKMFELSANTLKLTDIKTISVNGNRVACLLHWNASQPAGGILDVDNIDVYTVDNGKIIKAEIFTADEAKEDQFWGN
jgi:ketosteroid isomerase-like protein